jgi:hypothetical protein
MIATSLSQGNKNLPARFSGKELTTLADSIRARAVSHYHISLAQFYESAAVVFRDERLDSVNPESYATYDEYVLDILLAGSPVQRSALLDLIPKDCDLAMPELRTLGRKPALELLTTYIVQTCKILGCDFEGDRTTVINQLFDEYAGFSVLEWARFFYRIQKSQYSSKYQSVNTRGLNAEFLHDWITQYCDDRYEIITRLRREMPAVRDQSEPSTQSFDLIKKLQAEAADINGRVHHWWVEYENALTERTMEEFVTTETIDGKTVTQKFHAPMVKDKPAAAYTRLKDFLQVFYCQDGKDAAEVIVTLMDGWEISRASFFPDTTPQDFYRARAKDLYRALRRFTRPEVCAGIVRTALIDVSEKHPMMQDFYRALTGKEYTGGKPYVPAENYIGTFAETILKEFHAQYFENAKLRLETPGAFPLTRDEFIFLSCVNWSKHIAKIAHPFDNVLNIQQ